jgi:hypothetical protein
MAEEEAKNEESKSEDEKDSELTKFKSERQLAGGLVQGIGQALIQWMPVGGSGAVFLTFLLQQNWLMAIVIFPVTLIMVFLATFTDGLLSKIQEIAKRMAEESGTFLEKWLRAILEGVHWQLAGTEANYLKCQGLEVSQSKTEGLSTFKPSLKDVFIPLELSGEFWRSQDGHNLPMPMGFHSAQEVSEFLEKSNEFRIWDILRGCPRNSSDRSIVIQAWGGYGKTTLLRHVTYIYCHQLYRKAPYSTRQGKVPKLLPVLLPFRQWQETIYNDNTLANLRRFDCCRNIMNTTKGSKLGKNLG